MKLKGYVKIKVWRKGRVVVEREGSNLLTSGGKDRYTELIADDAVGAPSHMAHGDGEEDLDVTHTALTGTENQRVAMADNGTAVGNSVTYLGQFTHPGGASMNVSEVGVFDAGAGGLMFLRFLTQQFVFRDGDSMDVSWTLTVG